MQLKKKSNGKCKIYATGGAWHYSSKYVGFKFEYAEDLTVLGVAFS